MAALKLIQIAVAQWSDPKTRDRKYSILGLDADGQVYRFRYQKNAWVPVSMEKYSQEIASPENLQETQTQSNRPRMRRSRVRLARDVMRWAISVGTVKNVLGSAAV